MRSSRIGEVKLLLKRGHSDKEIASEMSLSVQGVKYYIGLLNRQAGLYGRADCRRLVVWLLTGRLSE